MAETVETQNFPNVDARQAAWDATIQTVFQRIARTICTYAMTIHTQGDTATPSVIWIQLCDIEGAPITDVQDKLCVRVCDDGTHAPASNATIAPTGGTTDISDLLDSAFPGTTMTLLSDAAGLFEIELTDASEETVEIRHGQARIGGRVGTHFGSLQVTHAAP